jgi:hypothetical protein
VLDDLSSVYTELYGGLLNGALLENVCAGVGRIASALLTVLGEVGPQVAAAWGRAEDSSAM